MERTKQQDIRFRDHLGTGALTSKGLQERLSLSRTGHGKGNSQPTNSTVVADSPIPTEATVPHILKPSGTILLLFLIATTILE